MNEKPPSQGGSAGSNPVGATHRSRQALDRLSLVVIEFWRYIGALDVPDGLPPTYQDAVAGTHVNTGYVLAMCTAMPERRDLPVLRRGPARSGRRISSPQQSPHLTAEVRQVGSLLHS